MCALCRRGARGWGYLESRLQSERPPLALCSKRCCDITRRLHGMIDPNRFEQAALEAASLEAGRYVETLGKTDLAHFSFDEWCTFVALIVTGFQDALREGVASQDIVAEGL